MNNTKLIKNENFKDQVKHLENLTFMMAHNLRGSAANIKMPSEVLMGKKIADECQGEIMMALLR